MTDFNADMLKLARDIRELTQADLARDTGYTQALISKLENGILAQPTDEVLAKLSEVLKFPAPFFSQVDRAEGFPHFHFRKRAKLGAKPLAHINAVINLRRMHVAKLMRSYEVQVHKPIPQIDLDGAGATPEKVAEQMREYWMLPRGPIADVTRVIEEAGGIVILCRFGTNLIDGISFRSAGLPPLFCMNREVPGDRYRLSLAHELGHMVMHAIPDDEAKQEEEAFRFASAFLMPAAEIKAHLSAPKLSNLGRVKAFWKVSIKSLIYRSHQMKLITDQQYKNLLVGYSKAFKDGEPYALAIEQPARLKEMVRYHLEQLGYSIKELAELLCLSPDEAERSYVGSGKGLRLVVSN